MTYGQTVDIKQLCYLITYFSVNAETCLELSKTCRNVIIQRQTISIFFAILGSANTLYFGYVRTSKRSLNTARAAKLFLRCIACQKF